MDIGQFVLVKGKVLIFFKWNLAPKTENLREGKRAPYTASEEETQVQLQQWLHGKQQQQPGLCERMWTTNLNRPVDRTERFMSNRK